MENTKDKNVKSLEKKASNTKKTRTVKNINSEKNTTKSEKTRARSIKSTTTKRTLDSKEKKSLKYLPNEYYDLPYRYNQTMVKILAQTPHSLFIYWDISDNDRKEMIDKYGENFFYKTKPVLLVHNQTLNTSFEVEIDDFTNSWYLKTPTSNCVFNIELGRKIINNDTKIQFNNNSNILHITNSNTIESPNDHILKDSLNNKVYFKNIKTNELEERDVSNMSSINNIYSFYEAYNADNDYENNPSSGFKIS